EAEAAVESEEPRTAVEEIVAGVLGGGLGRDRVGGGEDFFDLGGDSLLGAQGGSGVREGFGVGLPVRTLFEAPTVAGLAKQVESAGPGPEPEMAIEPVSREQEAPLSFAQQRLWFIDQLEPGSATYNSPRAFRVIGKLDIGALAGSLSEIVRRHE